MNEGAAEYPRQESNGSKIFGETQPICNDGGAESGAPCVSVGSSDRMISPDLAPIVKAWPTLPQPIRKAILAIVEQSTGPA